MSTTPTAATSHSRLDSIFASAFRAYKKKTGKDITSHPLAAELQPCNSPDAILAVLRNQIPTSDESQSSDEVRTKWLVPTINVLYAFSATLGEGVGLTFSPAKVIFTGIGVLLLAAKDVSASQDILIDIFNRIENFFLRLEIYTEIRPTTAMTDMIVQIMVEVLTIMAVATKEMKRGRLKKYFKKLIGNTEVEDSLRKLDNLTQEEARMAAAELLKAADRLSGQVTGVGDRVEDVSEIVQEISGDVHDVSNKLQDVDERVKGVGDGVQGVGGDVKDVNNKVQGIDNKVQGIDDKVDQVNRNQLRDSLLRWLSPPDPSINHNIASKAHHNGTTQWFIQGSTFHQWRSTGSLLWIHGKPGSGKSILCSSIIEDILTLRDTGTASVAYFYFDFRDVDKQKLHNLLPSLLIQLSAQSDSCCDILFQLYSAHDRGVRKPSDRAMVECLKEMLINEAQRPTYIILDALDECPIASSIPSPREEVLELVEDLVGLNLQNLHICVTSRPELDIQTALEPLASRSVSLHDETGQKQDIADYVKSFVRSDRRIRRWREEDKNLVVQTLSERADGMFRWVFCQLEVLRHCFPPSVRHILEELPEGLDETYERLLREIRRPNQRHAQRLLQCLVVAVRPLRVEELAEVLAFDFNDEGIPKLNPSWRWEDQEEAVMLACSSLVAVIKDGESRIVQFSHFSVKEFLTSNRLAEPSRDVSRYHILLEPAHTILAQACLGVLLRLDDHVDRDNIKNFLLAEYAAQYWAQHARFGDVASRIKDGMECLFNADKPHFTAWLWIHDEDRSSHLYTFIPEKPEAVPVYYASRLGLYSLVESLIAKHPEDLHAKGGRYRTPLHVAVARGHVDTVLLLLKYLPVGLKSTFRDQTPLHNAAIAGQVEVGRHLLDRGADVNAREGGDWTPLHLAAWNQQFEFVRLLLDHGADIHALTMNDWMPSGMPGGEASRILSEYGANPTLV